jgi:predicted HAD superfamily Cof-like phosphohydrolase
MSKWYEDVKEFHKAFNHPIGTTSITSSRIDVRFGWVFEELSEFFTRSALIDKIDAMIDLAYFIIGTGVEIGWDPMEDLNISGTEEKISDYEEGCYDYDPFSDFFIGAAVQKIGKALKMTNTTQSKVAVSYFLESLKGALSDILKWFSAINIDPRPFWDIVQNANMAKLWPDGKPHYREGDGKVIKPEGWEPPEPKLLIELEKQQKQMEENGVDILDPYIERNIKPKLNN